MTDPFGEQWFSEASQRALSDLYRSVADLNGRVVEVGCWTGRSTCALARACGPETVHAVDTWEGSPGEVSADLAKDRDVLGEFQANIAAFTTGNVETHHCDWRSYFTHDRQPIKFLHIDATHTYDEVAANIASALPLLVPGAVVCGDDAHHPPVQQAVLETLGNCDITASLWHWRKEAQ